MMKPRAVLVERESVRPIERDAATALRPFADALASDGYTISVWAAEDDSRLTVQIHATSDACEDCLAPRSVLQPMLESLLQAQEAFGGDVEIVYPADPTP